MGWWSEWELLQRAEGSSQRPPPDLVQAATQYVTLATCGQVLRCGNNNELYLDYGCSRNTLQTVSSLQCAYLSISISTNTLTYHISGQHEALPYHVQY
jgi:hypothetical protein